MKVWITKKEILLFYRLPILATDCQHLRSSASLYCQRVHNLVTKNGSQFTFLYLKECNRLCMQAIGGHPELLLPERGVLVKRDPYGIPTLLPLKLRLAFRADPRINKEIRLSLSLLLIYRVLPTKVKPDLGSITDPFSGVSPVLPQREVQKVVRRFIRSRINFGKVNGFVSESTGPNCGKSTWGSAWDAFALARHPKWIYWYLHLCWNTKSWKYAIWFVGLLTVFGPLFILLKMIWRIPPLYPCRLGVVYDQAGKARIVGITNWWIQISLYPLHKTIFRFLKKVKEDGTYNQIRPLKFILENDNGHKYYSFDLSSATDRLPLLLQRQILSCLGLNDSMWAGILNVPWYYRGKPVWYAVGQPMGAYSSWAMLALTHHVLVRVCALRAGLDPGKFSDYAVLGDDIVIHHDAVASEYRSIIAALGVSISFEKSLVSSDTLEFAKKLYTRKANLTPLGPGVQLLASRKKEALSVFVAECIRSGLAPTSNSVENLINSLPKKFDSEIWLVLQVCFGLNGIFSKLQPRQSNGTSGCAGERGDTRLLQGTFYSALYEMRMNDLYEARKNSTSELTYFLSNWWKVGRCRSRVVKGFSNLLTFCSPHFWIYLDGLLTESLRSEDNLDAFIKKVPDDYSWNGVYTLARAVDTQSFLTIDWYDRASYRKANSRILELTDRVFWMSDNNEENRSVQRSTLFGLFANLESDDEIQLEDNPTCWESLTPLDHNDEV